MTEQKEFDIASALNHCQDGWIQLPLCRLCANGNKNMVSIYGEEGRRMALAYKINKHLPFTVSPENKLPLNVCQKCLSELNASMNFVRRCMENQAKLRNLLNISVEDCDYETQEIYETKYQKKESKRRASAVSKKVSRQRACHEKDGPLEEICVTHVAVSNLYSRSSHENDYPLEETCEKQVAYNDQVERTGEKEFDENEDDNLSNNCTASVDDENQENNVISSSEVDLRVSDKHKSNDGNKNETLKINCLDNNGEGAAPDDIITDSVTKGKLDLKQFCQYCDAGFVWKADLFAHQIEMHPELVFRCSFCLKVFYNKEEFYSHELAHRKQLLHGFKGKLGLQKFIKGEPRSQPRGKPARRTPKALDEISLPNSMGQKKDKKSPEDSISEPDCLISSHGNNNMELNSVSDEICGSDELPSNSSNENRKQVEQDSNAQLSCHHCPMTFSSNFALKKHEATHKHTKKKSFRCKICNSAFVTQHLLKTHLLCHSPRKFQCEICLDFFNSKNEVEEHVQTHAGKSSYLCEVCGLSADSFVIFRLHKMDHLQGEYYKCNQCQKSFSNSASLKNHMLGHSKKKKFICKICSENFPTGDLLREHKLSHEGEDLKCDVCNKSFTGYRNLKSHLQIHSVGRNYLCEKCGKDFKSNSSLHKHRYLCQVAIACTVCGKEFDCNTRLKVHMRMHTGEKPYVCSVCGKGFHASWSLSQHSATHNTVKIPCPLCGALFNRKSNMLTHKKRHRVPCGICGKVFANIPVLLAHQKTHDGNGDKEGESEAPKDDSSVAFRCEQCGKLFMTSLDLKAHMSTHSTERPYKCDICGKSWRLQKTLKKHMVMHSGRKPYQCRYCPCTFLLHQRLVKHENGHTAGKPFTCQDCGQSFWTQLNLEKHTIRHCAMKIVDQKYACKVCDSTFDTKASLMSHKREHSHQTSYYCAYCPRKFSQARHFQRHKCPLDPNNQVSSTGEIIFKSMPSLTEEESCSPDENTCPGVLNEEVVYDMDSVSPSYAEIIVISQEMDDIMVENSNELNNSV